MTIKAAGYARVSTQEQARDGFSLAAQEQAIRALCEVRHWDVETVYCDAGRSGGSMRGRDALARLLEDAKAGHFEKLVYLRGDRLARNLRDLLHICDILEAAGVDMVGVQDPVDLSTPFGRAVRSFSGLFAELDRDLIRERVREGITEKARQGHLVGPIPLGYVRDESGVIAVDPGVAPLIAAAFRRYASGAYSLKDIADWAAGVGLVSRRGKSLDRLSIRKMLKNVAYTGQVALHARSGGSDVFEGKHPAIIDRDLFESVQRVLARRRRFEPPGKPFGRVPYPLSGARCAYWGEGLSGCSRHIEGKYRYEYYRCSTAHRRGRLACKQPMVRTWVLEDQLAGYLGGMVLPAEYLSEVVDELRQRQGRAREDRRREDQQRRELDRWHRLFVLGEIDEQELKARTGPLRRNLEASTEPRTDLDAEKAVAYLRDVGQLWAGSPRELQREFVREVFQEIEVKGKEITALTPKAAYAPMFVLDRRERFGQDGPEFCNVAPRAGFEPTT